MASIVKEAPEGFEGSVEFMNGLKQDLLTEIKQPVSSKAKLDQKCYEVLDFLQYKVAAVKTDHWLQKIQETNRTADITKVQGTVNSLINLYRAAAGSQLSEEKFSEQLGTSMVISEATQSSLTSAWTEKGKPLVSSGLAEHCLGVGQLVDIQWKVGVAMSSDSCKSLNSPFVCLALTVVDTAGKLTTHNLELTMLQFRNFTNQLKEIASVLETV